MTSITSSSSSSTSLSSSTGPSSSITPTSFSTTNSAGTVLPTGGNPNNNGGNNSNIIQTSASLYLYTFLATLVLLLSVSAAIVIRSFILRRRHRLMVEEAIRNGTWIPPAPPTRQPKVDLSKKPQLWEAYIDKKGELVGFASGGMGAGGRYMEVGGGNGGAGKAINEAWRVEQAREWDAIRPFAAAYLATATNKTTDAAGAAAAVTSTPQTPGTNTPNRLPTVPSVGSLRSAVVLNTSPSSSPSTPVTPVPPPPMQAQQPSSAPSSDSNTSGLPPPVTASASSPGTTTTTPRRNRLRSVFREIGNILSPTPSPSSPLPAALNGTRSNAGSTPNLLNAQGGDGAIAMEELNSMKGPKMLRVAVLIAMPSPPVVDPARKTQQQQQHGHTASSSSLTTHSTNSDPLQSVTAPSIPQAAVADHNDDDDEQPLPHLEMGVADVVLLPSSLSSSAHEGEGAGASGKSALGKHRESGWSGMSEGSET